MTEHGTTYAAAGVSIEAGDKAVELMKVWIDKARRPEMLGGIGGFAGLVDASALRRWTSTTRSASTWSGCSSTTSWSAGPSRCS